MSGEEKRANETTVSSAEVVEESPASVLVIDDETPVRKFIHRALQGCHIAFAASAEEALGELAEDEFDVIVSDIWMPGLNGVQLLKKVRELGFATPVILITGAPDIDSAAEAVEYDAFRYLPKPLKVATLRDSVARAAAISRLTRLQSRATELVEDSQDLPPLSERFSTALSTLHLLFQPIVNSSREVVGYEALVRSDEPTLREGASLLQAAESYGLCNALVHSSFHDAVHFLETSDPSLRLYLNLHPQTLMRSALDSQLAALEAHARRVSFEVSESKPINLLPEASEQIQKMRELGFAVGLDDFGSGQSAAAAFACLDPEFIKLDGNLVQSAVNSPFVATIVESVVGTCTEMNVEVIAECVETEEQFKLFQDMGVELFQGWLFGRAEAWKGS